MGAPNKYTDEQLEFLKVNSPLMSRGELTERFNANFGTEYPLRTLMGVCNKNQWHSPSDGRFSKDSKHWQVGLSNEKFKSHYTKESLLRVKAGLRNQKGEAVHKKGEEVIRHGEWYVVMSDNLSDGEYDGRIKQKAKIMWEQAHGKIPPHHRLLFLDGNKLNCTLDNVAVYPTKYTTLMNKNKWLKNKNPEFRKTVLKWCEHFYVIRESEKSQA